MGPWTCREEFGPKEIAKEGPYEMVDQCIAIHGGVILAEDAPQDIGKNHKE